MIAIRPEERDAIYRQDFIAFFRKAFEVLNPAEMFDPAWHLEAIARLLEDCDGTRARKIINAPPRSLKSFLVSVAWVAFCLSRVLMSRLNSKRLGTVIIVMQRLHMDDLTGHLMEIGGWDLLCLPAKALQDVSIPVWRGGYAWKIDEPLQPTREGYDVLDELKRELGAEAFHAQYLQAPVPPGGNMLKREWLKWCQLAPTRQSSDEIVLSVDTAAKASATSNYSVIFVFLVRKKNEFYLIDLYRKKLEFPDLLKATEALITKHKPKAVLIEDHSSGTGLCQQLKKNGCAAIIPIRPVNDKSTRMSTETPKLEAGNLILPQVAPWIDDFTVEYLAFPNGKHDDQIDALSQFLNWQGNRPIPFSCDFGHGIDQYGGSAALGAPTAEDILSWRGLR